MPRPISWLPRLHEITRSVANSVRSHYDRSDLEKLFELQPRAAQKLLEMLPTVQVGTSALVDREVLGVFLDRVRESENTIEFFAEIRSEKAPFSRRDSRALRRDLGVGLSSLPDSMTLSPGCLQVRFHTHKDVCESRLLLALVINGED